jgi:hypothetical protein
VTALDIAEALAAKGQKVDRRHIHLPSRSRPWARTRWRSGCTGTSRRGSRSRSSPRAG